MGFPDITGNGVSFKAIIAKNLFTVIISVAAALTVYYSTISSLQVALAKKVEISELIVIEKRLNSVENVVEGSLISRDDFYRFREDINYRLMKIEFKLENLIEGELDGRKR